MRSASTRPCPVGRSLAAAATGARRVERLLIAGHDVPSVGLGCPHGPVLALRAARFLPPPNSVLASAAAAARGMEGGRRGAALQSGDT